MDIILCVGKSFFELLRYVDVVLLWLLRGDTEEKGLSAWRFFKETREDRV